MSVLVTAALTVLIAAASWLACGLGWRHPHPVKEKRR